MHLHTWKHGIGITLDRTPVRIRQCTKCETVQRKDHGTEWKTWKQYKESK